MLDGVGPILRERLFKEFKTLKSLKEASLNELTDVKGINMNLASRILEHLESL